MEYTAAIRSTISMIESEYKRLASFFRTFDEARWKQPTYCTDWDASQVVGHLTLGADFYASTVRGGLEGNYGFPLGAKDKDDFMKIRTSRMDEYAALSGDQLVDRFEKNTKGVLELFQGLTPEDYEKRAWHRRGVLPIRYFIIQRLNEFSLHEWDIRNDPGAPVYSGSQEVATENLRQRFPIIYNVSPASGLEGVFRFETTDTGQAWAIEIQNGEAVDCTGRNGEYDASFFTTASDFLLLVTGRGEIPDKEKSGDFRIEGGRTKADALIPSLFFPI
ncbi:MAG: maleylpyruvate isomerase family mycothiol-dependent enzyme [bacterium]